MATRVMISLFKSVIMFLIASYDTFINKDNFEMGLPMKQDLLTSQEAARLLQISVRKLQQLSKRGGLRKIKIGKYTRYTYDDLVKWVDKQTV